MAWALWLAVPAAVTLLAALWVWWRGRPARVPGTDQAMREHHDYLEALAAPARGSARIEQR
jgi:hypothetical protein